LIATVRGTEPIKSRLWLVVLVAILILLLLAIYRWRRRVT
jgi:hypothetical protein